MILDLISLVLGMLGLVAAGTAFTLAATDRTRNGIRNRGYRIWLGVVNLGLGVFLTLSGTGVVNL